MSTNDRIKTSLLVTRQIPEYIRDNYPLFVEFIQTYYEYLYDTQSLRLESIHDIDETLDQFLDFFKFELARFFPIHLVEDRKFIIKHLREFYLSRGTPTSFEFLFRALFNEDVTITYPGEAVLIPSDGRWNQEKIITVESVWGALPTSPSSFQVKHYGAINTVKVTRSDFVSLGKTRLRLFFSHNATPVDFKETTEIGFTNSEGKVICVARIVPNIVGLDVIDAGQDWQIGQIIEIPGSLKNTLARVTEVNKDRGIHQLEIIEFGYDHEHKDNRYIVNPYRLKPSGVAYDITHEIELTNPNAFHYTFNSKRQSFGYSNESSALILVDYYSQDYTFEYVTKNNNSYRAINQSRSNVFGYEGPTIPQYPTPPYFADDFCANDWSPAYSLEEYVSSDYLEQTTDPVYPDYVRHVDEYVDLFSYFAQDYTVFGSDYVEINRPDRKTLDDIPYVKEEYDTSKLDDYLNANTLLRLRYGPVAKTLGYWSDDRGQISNEVIALQDNFYRQPFSYQVNSAINPNRYEDIINIVHPAGRKRFINYQLTERFSFTPEFRTETQYTFKADLLSNAYIDDKVIKEVTKVRESVVNTISDGAKIRSLKYVVEDYLKLGEYYTYPGEIVLTIAEPPPVIQYFIDDNWAGTKLYGDQDYFDQVYVISQYTHENIERSPKYIINDYTKAGIVQFFEAFDYTQGNSYAEYFIEETDYFYPGHVTLTVDEVPPYIQYTDDNTYAAYSSYTGDHSYFAENYVDTIEYTQIDRYTPKYTLDYYVEIDVAPRYNYQEYFAEAYTEQLDDRIGYMQTGETVVVFDGEQSVQFVEDHPVITDDDSFTINGPGLYTEYDYDNNSYTEETPYTILQLNTIPGSVQITFDGQFAIDVNVNDNYTGCQGEISESTYEQPLVYFVDPDDETYDLATISANLITDFTYDLSKVNQCSNTIIINDNSSTVLSLNEESLIDDFIAKHPELTIIDQLAAYSQLQSQLNA